MQRCKALVPFVQNTPSALSESEPRTLDTRTPHPYFDTTIRRRLFLCSPELAAYTAGRGAPLSASSFREQRRGRETPFPTCDGGGPPAPEVLDTLRPWPAPSAHSSHGRLGPTARPNPPMTRMPSLPPRCLLRSRRNIFTRHRAGPAAGPAVPWPDPAALSRSARGVLLRREAPTRHAGGPADRAGTGVAQAQRHGNGAAAAAGGEKGFWQAGPAGAGGRRGRASRAGSHRDVRRPRCSRSLPSSGAAKRQGGRDEAQSDRAGWARLAASAWLQPMPVFEAGPVPIGRARSCCVRRGDATCWGPQGGLRLDRTESGGHAGGSLQTVAAE